jgi:protein SCO1
MTRSLTFAGMALLLAVLTATWTTEPRAQTEGGPGILGKVGIDQKLGEQIPLDLQFLDEAGNSVSLRDYFKEKPVVLSLVYYDCPMLCTQVLNGLLGSMKALTFSAGEEFEVVTVSFDSRETPELALGKKRVYVDQYERAGAEDGWHFLTGSEASVAALTKSVGFRYAWDEDTQQFAHASGIMVLTPDGTLAKYFYGIEFAPRDLKLGLVEASDGKIGSPVDQILLYCFHYDPVKGKYGVAIMNIVRILGTATILIMGTAIFLMIRRGRAPQTA